MALFFIGVVIFSIGGCMLVGDTAKGMAGCLMVLGLILGVAGAGQHSGSGCDASGHCDHNHGVYVSP